MLMRFGLADPRNYDSVELARSLNWLAPLFEPGNEPLSSRGRISWQSADRARDRLEESCVKAVVGASPPPPGRFAQVEQVSEVWIAWLRPAAWASTIAQETRVSYQREPGETVLRIHAHVDDQIIIREIWDPEWTARIDDKPAQINAFLDTFMSVNVPSGDHVLVLEYRPFAVFCGVVGTALGVIGLILALTEAAHFWIPGITKRGLGRIPAPRLESS